MEYDKIEKKRKNKKCKHSGREKGIEHEEGRTECVENHFVKIIGHTKLNSKMVVK